MSVLDDLVNVFAKSYDCEVDMLKNGLGGSIKMGPVSLRMMVQPGSDLLVLQLPVGLLPRR
ncbi:hypothetical protein SAMN02910357_01787 [Succinivibrio dextrinosolvens]|uniref:hypothetical protein n=1 Tax=Succinivibrio dextrinosolvens TaxID=83771 RepID=UPI0008EC2D4B|nr:hypothetical protein [Succinivibrio dextrinosolvens]SFS77853.1 hypothetical protein SAMN02910357_01787 [Succinivibrio dextrinosolvens]